ncbi:MAG: protein kinase [Gemmataceae bacterium]
MEISDTLSFAQQVVKLGLVSQPEVNEALEDVRAETGQQSPDLVYLTRALERKGLLTNFQTSKILKGDEEGFYLGGFRILYKISSGSFGRVFRADEPRSGRVVALKVLRRRWSEDQQRIDLFVREGKVGLTLKHPNIVEVVAINQDPITKQYYIAMEFVEGGNVREILTIRKSLPAVDALKLIEDCTLGLVYAYSKGFTHRDIKLTNILVSSAGEAKLVDFGLAQMFAAIGREEEQVDRTVDYAGLEKATGVKSGDVRSDIFFLGCVFFEMLTGRPPMDMVKDRHARMMKRRFEEIQHLKPGEIQAPASVYQLCESMTAYDPKRRYQTPSQLLDAVRAARKDMASGGGSGAASGATPRNEVKSLFLVESHHGLQELLRNRFKEHGFRVLLASDPMRALDRFRQQPFDVLIVDAENTGDDGILVFDRVMNEARDKRLPCVGILILGEDQAELASGMARRGNARVLVRPVSWKQLYGGLRQLLGQSIK